MVTYVYECKACGECFEVKQSIKDKPLRKCFECDSMSMVRVIQPPLYVKVVGEPTTVGQLAEQNTRNMSSEQRAKLEKELHTPKTIDRIPKGQRPKTVEDNGPQGEMPAWMNKERTKSNSEIHKMNKEQREKYVFTGE